MRAMRCVVCLVIAGAAFGAHAQQGCEPSADVGYVCGVTNPEDLVLVPGTPWIVSSGMADGAGFYLVDSGSGNVKVLPFTAEHDPKFAGCTTPPAPQSLNTHGLNIRSSGQGRGRPNYGGDHGRAADADVARLRDDAGRPRGEQRRLLRGRLARRHCAAHGGKNICR
jgi:hypothetical protein